MDKETKVFLREVANICKGTVPFVASKPPSEKTLDDQGIEFLMSAYLFLYEGYTPNEAQFNQLQAVASTTALTYKELRHKKLDEQEKGLLALCKAYLYLWQQKVDFSREQRG